MIKISKIHHILIVLLQFSIILSPILVPYQPVQLIVTHNILLRVNKFILKFIIFMIRELFYQSNHSLYLLIIYSNLLYVFQIFLFLDYYLFYLDFTFPILQYLIKISIAAFLSFLFLVSFIKHFIY